MQQTNNPGPQKRDLASHLPPEVLSQIFQLALPSTTEYMHKWARKVIGTRFSLVCRSWRGPAQRLVLHSIVVKTTEKMKDFVNTSVVGHVHALKVDVKDKNARWTVKNLAALIIALPALVELELEFNAGSPGDRVSLRALEEVDLTRIKTLKIWLESYDKNFFVYQQLLNMTPNLECLSLGNQDSKKGGYSPPAQGKVTPINLPSLRQLHLKGSELCLNFANLGIFTTATEGRIVDLTLEGAWTYNAEGPSIPEAAKGSIRALSLLVNSRSSYRGSQILAQLPNLESVTMTEGYWPSKFPASVKFITFLGGLWWAGEACEYIGADLFAIDSSTVERFEVQRPFEYTDPDSQFYCDLSGLANYLGIDTVVDGVLYKPVKDNS